MLNKNILKITLLILIIFSGIAIPMTYARYKNDNKGTAKLNVAKWDVEVNDISIDEELVIDLFNSIENVSTSTKNYIMPGSQGSFDLKIKNKSDVTINYTIKLEEILNNKNIPIQYSLVELGEYKDDKDFIIAENEELLYGEINNTKQYKIYWKWPYYTEENLVITEEDKFKVKVNVTVNQVIEN